MRSPGTARVDRREHEVGVDRGPVGVDPRLDADDLDRLAERAVDARAQQLVQVVVARAHDRRGQQLVGAAAALEPAADVHRDVGDLVVGQRDAEPLLQPARDEHRDLEDHRVGRLERPGQRIARPRLLPRAVLQVLHVQREPQDEVLVHDVDEELRGRRLDDLAHGRLDLGIEARSRLVDGRLERRARRRG